MYSVSQLKEDRIMYLGCELVIRTCSESELSILKYSDLSVRLSCVYVRPLGDPLIGAIRSHS